MTTRTNDIEAPQNSGAEASTNGARGGIMEIIAQLREMIVAGRLMPHERLIEADLAASLHTNRTNIRTAFAVLEGEGLVVREPNRGARVRNISEDEAIEIAEARQVLEGLVAKKAAQRATPENCRPLQDTIEAMQAEYETGNLLAMSHLNGRLHSQILEMADNRTLTKLIMNLKHQLVRIQYRAILMPDRAAQSLKEHKRIVAAIVSRSEQEAEAAMRDHLSSVLENLQKSFEMTHSFA
ncbi:GntR family transcriptional regulator [Agaricicola taiwanensis]|uniref:GntR family transcriptional regulator n=1 Tax=Agaricicola taiwanensis TaxID=591372 RepID=A0A8J2VJH0_9RHOB|nr:GntR family transcriptional regulator [Agaricicola taiwanensis]GGE32809.1 GntR family transcriptional regulator [Agaricicola taiwanensis]